MSIAAGVIILNEGFKYYHIVGSIMILVGVWGTSKFGDSNKKIIPKEIELL